MSVGERYRLQIEGVSSALAHGDKLFSRAGVNANGRIEVGFGRAHLEGDRHPLNNLSRAVADHMRARVPCRSQYAQSASSGSFRPY